MCEHLTDFRVCEILLVVGKLDVDKGVNEIIKVGISAISTLK